MLACRPSVWPVKSAYLVVQIAITAQLLPVVPVQQDTISNLIAVVVLEAFIGVVPNHPV